MHRSVSSREHFYWETLNVHNDICKRQLFIFVLFKHGRERMAGRIVDARA